MNDIAYSLYFFLDRSNLNAILKKNTDFKKNIFSFEKKFPRRKKTPPPYCDGEWLIGGWSNGRLVVNNRGGGGEVVGG